MPIQFRILTLALTLVLAPTVFAQEVSIGKSVESLLDYAKERNPEYAAMRSEAEAAGASSSLGPDWKSEEAISSPEVAGLFIISPESGEPGAPPSEGMSLPSVVMSTTLDLNGLPLDTEASIEDPLISGKEIQAPSITTATVPPITYCVDLDFLLWIFIITPPVSPSSAHKNKSELFLTQSPGRSGQS